MLSNILKRLPSLGGSHYVEAVRSDPELMTAVLDREELLGDDDDASWAPAGTEWRQETELLTTISDQLATLLSVVSATSSIPPGGRQPSRPSPYPRPRRVIDSLRREREIERQNEMDDEVEQAKARYREAVARGDVPATD